MGLRGKTVPSLVSFSSLWCAATTGQSASAFCNLVATLLKTPVRPVWSCGEFLADTDRLILYHRQNQTRTCLSTQRDSGSAMTSGDFTATSWRNSKTLLQLSEMVANISAVAFFLFPVFLFVSSSASLSYSLLLLSLSPLLSSSSSDIAVMECAKILRRFSMEVSPSSITASVKNVGRGAALRGVQSRCFFNLARSPAAEQRSTSVIGRRILSLFMAKAMLTSIKTTEGESSDTDRSNSETYSPRDLYPMDAYENFSCTSPGVALLVSMARLGKPSHAFLYFLSSGYY